MYTFYFLFHLLACEFLHILIVEYITDHSHAFHYVELSGIGPFTGYNACTFLAPETKGHEIMDKNTCQADIVAKQEVSRWRELKLTMQIFLKMSSS